MRVATTLIPAYLALAFPLLAAQPALGQAAAEDPAQAAGDNEVTAAGEDGAAGVADLKVELTPSEGITVGNRVKAELVLAWMGAEPEEDPRFPAWQETWGSAEVVEAGEVDAFTDQSGRRIYRQAVTLTAFRTGEVRLPPVTVAVPLAERTEEVRSPGGLSFEIESVLPTPAGDRTAEAEEAEPGEPAGEALEPRPAAPPRPLATDSRFLWTAGILAALVALGLLWLARRATVARGERSAATVPLLPPLEELLERLRGLDPATGSEPVHTRLSLGLRRFLGRALDVSALESTTSEIQRNLRATDVPPALAQQTVRLLRDCDQVKFARIAVADDVTGDRLAQTRVLAREIDELMRADEEAELAAQGSMGAIH